jgi:hypothetical membrane protein
MTATKLVENLSNKYPFIGPILWLSSLQYFIIQLIVAKHWMMVHYSLGKNTISDLGNTKCGVYGFNYVCSPLHNLMNVSFIVLGVTMIAGSAFLYYKFKQGRLVIIGFSLMALAGLGTILVGSFPENTVRWFHIIGASLPFFYGNVGLIILGLSLKVSNYFRVYSVISGIIALVSLVLLITDHYLGLGPGGMERIVAYPQTVWLVMFGLYSITRRSLVG